MKNNRRFATLLNTLSIVGVMMVATSQHVEARVAQDISGYAYTLFASAASEPKPNGSNYNPSEDLQLCDADGTIDFKAYNRLKMLIGDPTSRSDALRLVDSSLVRAQNQCTTPITIILPTIGSLMYKLADRWWKEGNLARADQLYEQATANVRNDNDLLQIAVLQDWAKLKLARGETDQAKSLAARQVAVAQAWYERQQRTAGILADCLEFEARILEQLGSAEAAGVARREAAKYASLRPKCYGVCELDTSKAK